MWSLVCFVEKNELKIWYCVLRYLLVILGIMYATNIEGMSVLFFFIFACIYIYKYNAKENKNTTLVLWGVCTCSIFWHLCSTGNANRAISETAHWFPNYGMLNVVDRVELAFSRLCYEFIFNYNTVSFTLAILLFLIVFLKCNDRFYKTIGAIPLATMFIFSIISKLGIYSDLSNINYMLTYEGVITVGNFNKIRSYLPIMLGIIVCVSIIISAYIVTEKSLQSFIIVVIILLGGVASWMIMIFSPTIWASGERPFMGFYFVLISICTWSAYMLINSMCSFKKYNNLLYGIWIIACTNILNFII